uniref:Uncharacterized protein n=1 Tax=Rhizophora mucronata TaxID=61149 RepID=A0A2P2QHL3_RHIMU
MVHRKCIHILLFLFAVPDHLLKIC